MKKLRVLALMHPDLVPPETLDEATAKEAFAWKTEYDVTSTLRGLGHEVLSLGVQYDLLPIKKAVDEWHPDIAFNLLEEFHGETMFDHSVVSFLELLRLKYTGCNPMGMMLARGKALSKKLLAYSRIRTPAFAVFPRGRKVRRPAKLGFPLIVKSLVEHASIGIAQASVVDSDEKLADRVALVHDRIGTDAIAEEYIDGRELYSAVLGNERLQVLPTFELKCGDLPANVPRIATARVKHDPEYQEKRGIYAEEAKDLPPEIVKHIVKVTKRIYRILELDGYARIDFRLSPDGGLYFLEANPNPDVAFREEFAGGAEAAGMTYPEMIQRIVMLGMRRGGSRA
ncbi:MAG: hypothetical protein KJZ47_06610 [Gemmatimonadales bacterium]|nr:hypothetical protein [Gemmatimonadales bacterium]